jgi:hypothetical protein
MINYRMIAEKFFLSCGAPDTTEISREIDRLAKMIEDSCNGLPVSSKLVNNILQGIIFIKATKIATLRHWRKINDEYLQFIAVDGIGSVWGLIQLHHDVPEGHYPWYWEARVLNIARTKEQKPISGYAETEEKARYIVERILLACDQLE